MPGGRYDALRASIAKEPWDAAAWEGLVALSAASGSLDQQREILEELLSQFPTAAIYWQRYAEMELDEGNPSQAKLVFSRCLLSCPNVKLWTLYLRFIKKMNEAKGIEGLSELRKSYEYTLERVGADSASGSLWQEYINFLQAPRAGAPAYQALFSGGLPGQEETQRILWLRRAYHKALTVPGRHLDQLWRAYEEFERKSSNAQLARREIDEQRPRYNAAKKAAGERARLQQSLLIYNLALPPGKGGRLQEQQVRLWKEYIEWEKSNPQRLDGPSVAQRVSLAFDQALMPLLHYPEIWYSHSKWHAVEGGGGPAAAAAVLTKARATLPECSMLHFAAAELEEARGEVDAARAVFEEQVQALPPAAPKPSASGNGLQEELPQDTREAGTLVWIQFMRFSRRVDGVAASRKIFLRARRWHGCSWQVFVAAAHMEYEGDGNDRVARNVFELGLDHFLGVPGYVLQYADFLIGLADLHNARALFERALGETPPQAAKPLWDRYIQVQSMFGDLASVTELEQRRREALGPSSTDDMNVLVLKHRFLDIWPCSAPQQTHLQRLFGELPPLAEARTDAAAQQQANAAPQQAAAGPSQAAATARPEPSQGNPSQGQQAVPQSPGRYPAAAEQQPPQKPEPIKQMPPELGMFLAALPAPRDVVQPYASVDAVIDTLMKADLSAGAVAAAEAAAHRPAPVTLPAPVKLPVPHQGGGEHGKRDRDEPEAGEILENAPPADMYRARVKQRIKRGA